MTARPRPTVKPWLPQVRREPGTLQIGCTASEGVLVSGLDPAIARWLTSLDGSRTEADVLAEAAAAGLDVAAAARVLSGLSRGGVLLPAPLETHVLSDTGPLLPELVSLTAAHTHAAGGRLLVARSRVHVVIDGANRIGVPLGAVLAASGVGRISFLDPDYARRCDAGVGGLSLDDEGEPRASAAQQALRRISAMAHNVTVPAGSAPDLLILCQPWAAHDPLAPSASSDSGAHLAVAIRDGTVVVGPLVLPGRSSCLRCAELHRTDRDPRWPAVAPQLLAAPKGAMQEPTSVLATLAAALAAAQALDHLDGISVPEIVGATLELRPPDWQLHRRPWPPHPDCGCLTAVSEPVRASG